MKKRKKNGKNITIKNQLQTFLVFFLMTWLPAKNSSCCLPPKIEEENQRALFC